MEMFTVVLIAIFRILLIAAVIWGVVKAIAALRQLRKGQESILVKLEDIARTLQKDKEDS